MRVFVKIYGKWLRTQKTESARKAAEKLASALADILPDGKITELKNTRFELACNDSVSYNSVCGALVTAGYALGIGEDDVEILLVGKDDSVIAGSPDAAEDDETEICDPFAALGITSETRGEEKNRPSLIEIQKNVAAMKAELLGKVKGQTHAIDAFARAYFGAEMLSGEDLEGPLATFFFVGPQGCGKTYLAECAAPYCDGRKFLRVDMNGYGEGGSVLCGDGMFVQKEQSITSFVKKNGRCFILFDEVEKASAFNKRLILQILETGKIRDSATNIEVSFADTVLVFTTNAARNLYEESEYKNLASVSVNSVISALENDKDPMTGLPYFPKDLVACWAKGTVIAFDRLEPYALKEIVVDALRDKIRVASENTGVDITCDYDDIAALIVYSTGGGSDARTVKSAAAKFVESELFDALELYSRKRGDVSQLKKIEMIVDGENGRCTYMFGKRSKVSVLLAANKRYFKDFRKMCADAGGIKPVTRSDGDAIKEAFRNEIDALVLDVLLGEKDPAARPADLNDNESDGVDIFNYVRETYPEVPVYILADPAQGCEKGAFDTFIMQGAKGVLVYDPDDDGVKDKLRGIREATVTGNNFYKLARSMKVLCYDCAQLINKSGEEMRIVAKKLDVRRAVTAEDSSGVVAEISKPRERFKDVVGAGEAKKALTEFTEYLNNPRKYTSKGYKAPKGVLLYGPPGTGKTLLAKALAGETDVTFIEKNGTSFFKRYVGDGPESIRRLFRTARRYAPSIIFIDEVDAFAKARTGSDGSSAAEQLLNAFLSEMEGFRTDENRPVILLVATNYDIKSDGSSGRVLDPAFVRRFDRKILIGLPDKDDRAELIRFFLRRHGIDPSGLSQGIDTLSKKTVGYSQSDLSTLVNNMIKNLGGEKLTDRVLEEAQDREEYGEIKKYSKETMRRTARHEAGHAVVSWACGSMPVYLTVVSRGDYGGYMMPDDDEDGLSETKRDLLDSVCCALGGRVSETVYYGKEDGLSTGAASDLAKATKVACKLVGSWGMSDMGLAVADYFGEAVDREVFAKVNALLSDEAARAEKIILRYKKETDKLSEALLERNSLNSADIRALIGDCPSPEE